MKHLLAKWGLLMLCTQPTSGQAELTTLRSIAFGSCAKQYTPQPIWDSVIAGNPDLFIFLGDNIYGDTTDMTKLRAKYQQLGAIPGYRKLKHTAPYKQPGTTTTTA